MMKCHLLAALFLATSTPQDAGQSDWLPVSAPSSSSGEDAVIDRGEGEPKLRIRSDEELVYDVEISGISVGEARFRSKATGSAEGSFQAHFTGKTLIYELDFELLTKHLSTDDPVIESFDTQRGSESRRREVRILKRDGEWISQYRSDGHCEGCKDKGHVVKPLLPWDKPAHCKKCKKGSHRVMREPRVRSVPSNALDFLSCIYLIRPLILGGLKRVETPLLDKDRLWNLSLIAGEKKVISVPAGKFPCKHIVIEASRPASEPEGGKFSGLFGMKGSMKFWVHETTGVLVQISGELPLGPFSPDVEIRLKEAKKAPAGLRPLKR